MPFRTRGRSRARSTQRARRIPRPRDAEPAVIAHEQPHSKSNDRRPDRAGHSRRRRARSNAARSWETCSVTGIPLGPTPVTGVRACNTIFISTTPIFQNVMRIGNVGRGPTAEPAGHESRWTTPGPRRFARSISNTRRTAGKRSALTGVPPVYFPCAPNPDVPGTPVGAGRVGIRRMGVRIASGCAGLPTSWSRSAVFQRDLHESHWRVRRRLEHRQLATTLRFLAGLTFGSRRAARTREFRSS